MISLQRSSEMDFLDRSTKCASS